LFKEIQINCEGRHRLHKFKVLVLSSPALSQVIEHLFRDRPDFEVSISGLKNLGQAEPRLPELIVANVKPMSTRICRAVATIKRASPSSKLILICTVPDFARVARKCGADACLEDEKLVGHLLRTAQAVLECPRTAATGN
jgi:hypothetical protein